MATVRRATPEELDACLGIRRVVFIEGQAVPEADEVDGLDPDCHHVLACDGEAFIGTARLRITEHGTAKIERVAVLAEHRGHDVGRLLMDALETEAKALGHTEVLLGAQVQVIGFYEKLGYTVEGPEFMDAGIPHRMMRKRI